MIRPRHWTTLLLPILLAALSGCETEGLTVVAEVDESYGFESGLAGWTVVADGGATGSATAGVSTERAGEGAASLRFVLDGGGDAFVLIARGFDVQPDRSYEVELAFDLASGDGGGVTPWTLRAGAGPAAPVDAGLLEEVGTTAGGGSFTFERRVVTVTGTADGDGTLWVSVGVEQASAGDRAYFVDGLTVSLTRR